MNLYKNELDLIEMIYHPIVSKFIDLFITLEMNDCVKKPFKR